MRAKRKSRHECGSPPSPFLASPSILAEPPAGGAVSDYFGKIVNLVIRSSSLAKLITMKLGTSVNLPSSNQSELLAATLASTSPISTPKDRSVTLAGLPLPLHGGFGTANYPISNVPAMFPFPTISSRQASRLSTTPPITHLATRVDKILHQV
jgi:hypothetical protein